MVIMVDYRPSEIVDMILCLGECHKNYRRAVAMYRRRYPNRLHPSTSCLWKIVRRARLGQLKRTRRTLNRVDEEDPRLLASLGMIHLNPHYSLRDIQRDLGVPRSTVQRLLKSVKYHPYHITLNQALTEEDKRIRVDFCEWALGQINTTPDFFLRVLFSDEATFHSTGQLNRHNSHYWAPENPHWHREIDYQHRWSVNVWCGILNGHLIGPHFFDEVLTGESYLEFLQNHFPYLLDEIDIRTRQEMWLQQDGAPPHFARDVRNYLNEVFPQRWIGRGGPIRWPPRSPDLTPPDFFLWGYIKNRVYNNQPTTPEDMRHRIVNACENIPQAVLLATIQNFQNRLQLCIQANGGTFEHLL